MGCSSRWPDLMAAAVVVVTVAGVGELHKKRVGEWMSGRVTEKERESE